jgi:hypothetical protein
LVGGKRALQDYELDERRRSEKLAVGPTVAVYLDQHIAGRSGVERKTLTEYRRYLTNGIGPALGAIPLRSLT